MLSHVTTHSVSEQVLVTAASMDTYALDSLQCHALLHKQCLPKLYCISANLTACVQKFRAADASKAEVVFCLGWI